MASTDILVSVGDASFLQAVVALALIACLKESDLSSSVSISASLANNLKADMAAAGVDSTNAG